MPDEVDPVAAPEVRQAVAGQTIKVAGNVVHTLAPGDTLVELPGVDVLCRVAGSPTPIPTPTPTPPPGLPARVPAGRALWSSPGSGGLLADADMVGTPADAAADYHGIWVVAAKADMAVRNVHLSRWSNGLCVEHTAAVLKGRNARWRFENVLFADNNGPSLFRSQGAYLAAADDVTFYRCCFVANGRDADRTAAVNGTAAKLVVASGFKKGCYVQGGVTQWGRPEGCRRVRFEECVFVNNAAEGVCGKGDGTQIVNCFFGGNAWGCMVNGPLPSAVTGNVVIPGPQAVTWYDFAQRVGAGGIQWRTSGGTLSDNLCVLPPGCRMPDPRYRAWAYELTLDANSAPNYHGPIAAAGANNYAFGWDDGFASHGVTVPGLKAGPCPVADWVGLVARAEREARAGTAGALELIKAARQMAGVN